LTDEQQQLASRYMPMARSLAKPLKRSWPQDGHDFEAAAMLALVEAAQAFDSGRNVKFSTFARLRITGALKDLQRVMLALGFRSTARKAPRVVPLTLEAEERGCLLRVDYGDSVGDEVDAVDYVESWLRKLPPRHAAACREMYINGRSQGETAEFLGCSRSRVSNLHREARVMLNEVWDFDARHARISQEKG
jgi:RNA polymerase sigma factor (sigma-70 family)